MICDISEIMFVRSYCGLLFILAFLFSALPPRSAELFRWVDERGVVHFTDNLHNIPEKYRAKMIRLRSVAPSKAPGIPVYPERASIPLKTKGRMVVVQAVLNGRTQGNFILDTGASYTVISWATAKELEIDLEGKPPKIRLQTANGVIDAPLVTLDSVEVGGIRVDDLPAAVHDFSQHGSISGLLGLNFLSYFRMNLDTENGVLVLEKK
ncbi:MAG: TIGR02281 family clan AA aspartic protease [Candidatus Binatia bacterium]